MSMGRKELLAVGEAAPEFRLLTLEGEPRGLAELTAAGPALLVFFKVTCPTCQLALPYWDKIAQAGGVRVVGIVQDNAVKGKAFNQAFGVQMEVLVDPGEDGYPASKAYGIQYVPTLFEVGAEGRVEWRGESFVKAELEAMGAKYGVAVFGEGDNVPAFKPG
jgi:peroxiredoxin